MAINSRTDTIRQQFMVEATHQMPHVSGLFTNTGSRIMKQRILQFLISMWIALGAHLTFAQASSAAGFMDNSLANFANIKALPDSWRDMIRMIGAVSYMIPPIVIVGCIVAHVVASNHSEGAASKTKVAILIIVLGMGTLWLYDTTMVGKV
jgi:hypothetical protein